MKIFVPQKYVEVIAQAVAAEREAIAEMVKEMGLKWWEHHKLTGDPDAQCRSDGAEEIATAIRARSEVKR